MNLRHTTRRELALAAAVVALVLGISALHYGTRTGVPLLHDTFRKLYYFPLGLAAVGFGLRGGLLAAAAVALLYAPHIAMSWNDMGRELANRVMEVILYFAFSGFLGYFSDQERTLRLQLGHAYRKLREQADTMLRVEEHLHRVERLAEVGRLAAAVTHEVRNPLGGIKGAAEILKGTIPPGHPQAEFLGILVRETDRLNQVVEDFLDHVRQPSGERVEAVVDLGQLVHQTARLVEAQGRARGVSLQVESGGAVRVRGSEGELRQVLLNLLLNAVEATPQGKGVWARVETRTGTVTGAEGRRVEGILRVVTVEDEGPGIPPEDLARVFDPFYTTKTGGTGLGLAISQRIARLHGGSITAETRPEGGARFVLSLPAAGSESGVNAIPEAALPGPDGRSPPAK
ncbi:MAG: ATP-binding protein [Thermodesulfobacteriota bacterium]